MIKLVVVNRSSNSCVNENVIVCSTANVTVLHVKPETWSTKKQGNNLPEYIQQNTKSTSDNDWHNTYTYVVDFITKFLYTINYIMHIWVTQTDFVEAHILQFMSLGTKYLLTIVWDRGNTQIRSMLYGSQMAVNSSELLL